MTCFSDAVSNIAKKGILFVVPSCFLIPFSSFNKFLFSHFPVCVHVARLLLCWVFLQSCAGEEGFMRKDGVNEHDLTDTTGRTLKNCFPRAI